MTTLLAPRGRGLLVDQVADALALIPRRAAAARGLVGEGDPRAERAVVAVARAALEALEGLRVLLPLVSDTSEPPFAPVPGLAEVRLEAARRAHDPRVCFDLDLGPGFGRVPAGVQLVLHHAVTTALALHDAGTGTLAVRLLREGGHLELAAGFGPGPTATPAGLVAIRRRATLYGGRVRWVQGRLLVVRIPVPESGDASG